MHTLKSAGRPLEWRNTLPKNEAAVAPQPHSGELTGLSGALIRNDFQKLKTLSETETETEMDNGNRYLKRNRGIGYPDTCRG